MNWKRLVYIILYVSAFYIADTFGFAWLLGIFVGLLWYSDKSDLENIRVYYLEEQIDKL